MATLNYIELPVASLGEAQKFYTDAFGWNFTAYGPAYAAHEDGPCQLGLNADQSDQPAVIMPIIESDDLEAALAAIVAAGGTITRQIEAYPGGSRFQFRDPGGLELAVYKKTPSE